jgi:hypothetical protein
MQTTFRLALAAAIAVGLLSGPCAAQEPESVRLAQELVQLMADQKLEALAAKYPDSPDRYVAALCYPSAQLLVVSARYPVPVLFDQRLATQDYREAYLELYSAGLRQDRLFIDDLLADGLRPNRQPNAPFDSITDAAGVITSFDGDWQRQRLSEREYLDRYAAAEQQYTKMLEVLLAQLKKTT